MIKLLDYERATGKILQVRLTSISDAAEIHIDGLIGTVQVAANVDPANSYFEAGELKQMPARPSPHHVFYHATKQWLDPRTPATQWALVRKQRNTLLSACDFTQLPDSPKDKHAWAVYRQALRDITTQPDPFNITWPSAPI